MQRQPTFHGYGVESQLPKKPSEPKWPVVMGGLILAVALTGNLALTLGLWLLADRPTAGVISHGVIIGLMQMAAAACAFAIPAVDQRSTTHGRIIALSVICLLGGILFLVLTRSPILIVWIGCLLMVGFVYAIAALLTERRGRRLLASFAWLFTLIAASLTWLNVVPYGMKQWANWKQGAEAKAAAEAQARLPQNRIVEFARRGELDQVAKILADDPQVLELADLSLVQVAVENGDTALLDLLLANSLNLKQPRFRPYVAAAIEGKKREVALQLVKHGAPAESSSSPLDSEIVLAANARYYDVVTALLEQQPPDASDRRRATRLLAAVASDYTREGDELLAHLLKQGFQFNNIDDSGRVVISSIAEIRRHPSMPRADMEARIRRAKFWVESEIGVNYTDWLNRTSLLLETVELGDIELLKYLFAHGCKPNQGLKQPSPLPAPVLIAMQRGKTEVVREFLAAGLDAKQVEIGSGVLNELTGEACQLLIERGATFDASLVQSAISKKDYQSLKVLLSGGYKLPRENRILVTAIKAGDLEMTRFLLDHGADVNYRDANPPPITIAIHADHLEIIRLLLERGADPNQSNIFQPTPLEVAKTLKKTEIVELLENFKATEKEN